MPKPITSSVFPRNPLSLMYRMYRYILPEVNDQLGEWRRVAEAIPDPELRKQAIDSMTSKAFHCQGGAVYAAADHRHRHILIPLIVAFQTISDYLDNLCDRSTSMDPNDFRLLHQSMLDAVNPKASPQDYYAYRGENEDGDYLLQLVRTCQSCICLLPSYDKVQPLVTELVSYYCDLQVYKHIRVDLREQELFNWWGKHQAKFPDLNWNEFAAATGSTLGVFMLFLAAADKLLTDEEAALIKHNYFPSICGLHILLDYLIDQHEDHLGGDLNFCSYYDGLDHTIERMRYIVTEARHSAKQLDSSSFHTMVVEGLIALYLSDPKAKEQSNVQAVTKALMKNSPAARLFFWVNSVWIRKKM
jgi:tetraprenyl-beta-curcumene synthase